MPLKRKAKAYAAGARSISRAAFAAAISLARGCFGRPGGVGFVRLFWCSKVREKACAWELDSVFGANERFARRFGGERVLLELTRRHEVTKGLRFNGSSLWWLCVFV